MSRRAKSAWLFLAAVVLVGAGVAGGAFLATDGARSPGRDVASTGSTLLVSAAQAEPANGSDFAVLQSVNRALRDIVTEARESVVRVESTNEPDQPDARDEDDAEPDGRGRGRRNPFELPFELPFSHPDVTPQPRYGLGSGVIVREDGYILTNNHVVEDADVLTVTLANGREHDAKLIGRDPQTDLAVIKIDADGLTAMSLADSDALQIGEFVVAIGAPFGLSHSASFGMVSAKGRQRILPNRRDRRDDDPYEDFIQTDAAINPGNSGGPLLNIDGDLVGVNTAISSETGQNAGVGFAVSSKLASKVLTDIIERGKVVRAWLGVMIGPVEDDVAQRLGLEKPQGALVSSVVDGSPASKAGLEPFDIILLADGRQMDNHNELRNYISSSPVGKKVELTVLRDGQRKELTVSLGELDSEAVAQVAPDAGRRRRDWTGMTVEDISSLDDDQLDDLPYDLSDGVIVTSVRRNSPAARKGIEPGTLIIAVDDTEVHNVREYRKLVDEAEESVYVKWQNGANYGIGVLNRDD
ncbi:Do family serine endopeptidase [Candidatus Poribacteria bacterium]|nr:Do family serine endopeptidase [Candidatus Poribacteria bacterium]MBT5710542.1 Do family serine endopeptidase [Candidatus Poribacteria bacterium]MBT7096743.1 Do family serine endopeptidase [Candidatus Poribacteria bacterium]MBT7806301.1 Do family serine endopeptidase [Candidatus Poribacteria bacterium]